MSDAARQEPEPSARRVLPCEAFDDFEQANRDLADQVVADVPASLEVVDEMRLSQLIILMEKVADLPKPDIIAESDPVRRGSAQRPSVPSSRFDSPWTVPEPATRNQQLLVGHSPMAFSVNDTRVIAARFISRTGGEAAFFVGIWGKAAYEFGATAGQIAVLMAALGVSGLVGSAVSGMLIDRFGPRRVLMGAEIAFVPATLAVVATGDMASMTFAVFFFGLFSMPAYTALASFPPYLTVDEHRLARLNAAVETAGMAALISGSALGAAMAAWLSVDWVFYLDAVTSLVAVALVWGVRTREVTTTGQERAGGLAEIRAGFRFVYSHHRLRFYVLMATSMWLLFGLFSSLEPIFYRDVLGRGPEAIGVVNAILGLGLVAGTLAAARLPDRRRSAATLLWLLAANGLGAIIYIGTRSFAVVIVGSVVWGVVIGLFLPLVRTLIHLNSPETMVGRVMGTTTVHSEAAKLIPLLVAPTLAATVGVQPPMIVGGAVLIAIALASMGVARRLDRTRTVPVPPVHPSLGTDDPRLPLP